MLCSICKQTKIVIDTGEAVICTNNHVHCEKCLELVVERCLLCAAKLFKYSWTSIHESDVRNWSPEMILEWSRKNALQAALSEDSFDIDIEPSAEDSEGASMNLLYSRSKDYDTRSFQLSDSLKLSEPKLILDKPPPSLEGDSKCKLALGRKDTRQNLVEQRQQELRMKVMDEIFRSYRTDQRPKHITEEHINIKQLRTVGVSTHSTPRLLPEDSLSNWKLKTSKDIVLPTDAIKKTSPRTYNGAPPEYLLMNVDTSSVKAPLIQENTMTKPKTSGTDLRLQQIMGILLESEKAPSKEDQHFYTRFREKFSHMPLGQLEEIISSMYNEGEDLQRKKAEMNSSVDNDVTQQIQTSPNAVANCRRAYYNPPVEANNIKESNATNPEPQFQIIGLRNQRISHELLQTKIIDGTLNIPRKPIICPISTCQRVSFVSDFTKHIAEDHTKLPITIFPQQYKNFYLDPKLIHFGTNRCQFLVLVRNKIRNLGHEKFKDFIPILVMTTKLSLLEICSNQYRPRSDEVRKSTQNFVMIWLTGIIPPHLPIFFSLTVWARSGFMPACHMVHSGRVYSLSESQSPDLVRKSGQMLLLTNNQIDLLTNGGRHMLELQITVH